ncbi:DUF1376 domain-containing protein [Variovorax sp. PAMC26660]|uniref:DUF1376 domain-containing protein n=1 Tax=Variovorax sp. PAMC26660 TaxID=2762322 RepID=UPI00164E3470|nr:DUF1376 domain-containing protein [Variovorax sp. PAMC26660]QNK68450.1 DUF1376 domain-containing protein [Variovorax sp. PAMC26660]
MSEAPAPLTPEDCDLQDFPFMPLDVARLRDSDLASDESPEACWAAVLLWAASWHQVPAASMPSNDNWIAKQAGYAQRGKISEDWAGVREGAMRHWLLCSDGRLYHPVVAEKARDAWAAKLAQRWRTECGRIKKHNDRHPGANVPRPTFEQWIASGRPVGQPLYVPNDPAPRPEGHGARPAGDTPAGASGHPPRVPGETASKGQGEGEGQGDLNSVPKGTGGKPLAPPPLPAKVKTPEEMAKSELWRAAVSVLENGGCPVSQCRTFMGKLVVDYTFPVVQQAVAAAVTAQPADAREYLKATCQRLKGERPSANRQEALEQRGQQVVDDWAEGAGNAGA